MQLPQRHSGWDLNPPPEIIMGLMPSSQILNCRISGAWGGSGAMGLDGVRFGK
jgi:hypothetical protein